MLQFILLSWERTNMDLELLGTSIIGGNRGAATKDTLRAVDPHSGQPIEPSFHSATIAELEQAIKLAAAARREFDTCPGVKRAGFLRAIAEKMEGMGDLLIARATLESGLPFKRIRSELGRTCDQLRQFAGVVEEGSWVDARIDRADPDRKPLPKPDVRSLKRAVGPAAIFCASNFPLAFSVAGGDTASALAAGCPVVVMAHPAHPGTAELAGRAIAAAVNKCGLPEGVFSLLFSNGYELGQALVRHPDIRAVGFTGSRAGGRALMDLAAARPEPIPVFAEMSSINPTFILPGALAERGDEIANGLHISFTLGVGQFCTKPALVMMAASAHRNEFSERVFALVESSPGGPLLTPGIKENYERGLAGRGKIVSGRHGRAEIAGLAVNAAAFQTTAEVVLRTPELTEEVFGPTTVLVNADRRDELLELARSLEGQLTANIFGTDMDLSDYADLIDILATKAGRLVFNAFPTGVEVCPAMVHGGPYPATSDPRTTSVGTRAIDRFTRLVCYQGFPQTALPDELKDGNPLQLWRMVNGKVSQD
ncbi:MAG: aldehyde dehydrogenase (NADP(+)) [Pyrinomonadaceae bacterium]